MTKPSSVHLPTVSPRYKARPEGAIPPFSVTDSAAQKRGMPPPINRSDSVTVSDSPRRQGMSQPRYWLAGSSIVAGLLLMVDVGSIRQPAVKSTVCQSVAQTEAFLSREQLASLMAIPERSSKAAVRQAIGEPYCALSPLEVRAGVQAEREAYPLAFDAKTWVIILYEGEEYAGYDFKFPND